MNSINGPENATQRPELVSQVWFNDILNGEFTAPTDPSAGRTHTLARLASAAYEKGYRSYETDTGFGSIVGEAYAYNPSWAPHVEVTVLCDIVGETPMLKGISLRTAEIEVPLAISDESEPNAPGKTRISSSNAIHYLDPSRSLDSKGQEIVTEYASRFFAHA